MTELGACGKFWLERQWYGASANPWLRPLAGAFELAAKARRWAYRSGIVASRRLAVPVIVVGNLSVGGTGKTPLTIWLVEFLREAGFHPGVVSRGYGGHRRSHAPMEVVSESDPAQAGDEPVLIACRTGCPVFVAARRAAAGDSLLARHTCDLLIADDGLQHYALARDIEILVVDGIRRQGNGHCLPAGPLREPVERMRTVDFVVCRGTGARPGEYLMTVCGEFAVNLATGETAPLGRFAGQRVHALAGIGNPAAFFGDLAAHGLDLDAKAMPDHHVFRAEEITFPDSAPVLITEKDAVKCRAFATRQHWYVPVEARLPAEFGPALLHRLREKIHGQETA